MERQLCFRNSCVLHFSQNVVNWLGLSAGLLGCDRLIVLGVMCCFFFPTLKKKNTVLTVFFLLFYFEEL